MYPLYVTKAAAGSTVYDTKTQWGVVCKEFPFKMYGDTKDLPTRDWADEDGEDVYFPTVVRQGAYDAEVEFVYKGNAGTARTGVKGFVDYLIGRDATGGSELKIYDTYTGIGRQKVYVKSVSDEVFYKQDRWTATNVGEEVVTFKVTFRVTDPVTDITLSI